MTSNANPSEAWVPRHRSEIARAIWLAFGSGSLCSWRAGEMACPAGGPEDEPFAAVSANPAWPSPPDWIAELMSRLDALMPGPEEIAGALDADSLTLPLDPAAFRMPGCPTPSDAGTCLAAARVILACREDVLPPVFMTDEEAMGLVERASWAALMIGGEPAYLVAAGILGDPDAFAAREEPDDNETIETG